MCQSDISTYILLNALYTTIYYDKHLSYTYIGLPAAFTLYNIYNIYNTHTTHTTSSITSFATILTNHTYNITYISHSYYTYRLHTIDMYNVPHNHPRLQTTGDTYPIPSHHRQHNHYHTHSFNKHIHTYLQRLCVSLTYRLIYYSMHNIQLSTTTNTFHAHTLH